TTFRAGMVDPIWPTEPWYLFNNYRDDRTYLFEHGHRIVGIVLGTLTWLFALLVWWWTEPRRSARWLGVAGLAVILVAYAEFHRIMRSQQDAPALEWPKPIIGVLAISFGLVGLIAVTGLAGRAKGAGLRLVSVIMLAGVMTQGLLGGFRVKLEYMYG